MTMLDTTRRKPVLYLAGKIAKGDWRDGILGGTAAVVPTATDPKLDLFNPDYRLAFPAFYYGGPFFVSCDHGCGHRLNGHGAAFSCGEDGWETGSVATEDRQSRIFKVNKARVAKADIIFAYINESDCFGTLIEIGEAAAQRKEIAVALGPDLSRDQIDDLWMAQLCATQPIYHGSAHEAFTRFATENFITREVWRPPRAPQSFRVQPYDMKKRHVDRKTPASERFKAYLGKISAADPTAA
jgi:hypothetical protein